MQASVILSRAKDILQDITSVRWTEAELMRWLSDAQREVVLYRPEACVSNASVALAANSTKQSLPANALRLLDITRNMGANGATPGRAIRLVHREIMDAQTPDWHTATASSEVLHYMFDARDPKNFYVYPRPSSTLYVEAIYSIAPTEIVTSTQTLSVEDIFANVLLDYLLYRAYTKDSDYAGNGQRAVAHYQAFANALGIKGNIDVQFGPTANSPLNPNYPVGSQRTSAQ